MMIRRPSSGSVTAWAVMQLTGCREASVSIQPGATRTSGTPFGRDLPGQALAVDRQPGLCAGRAAGRLGQRQARLDQGDMDHHPRTPRDHAGHQRAIQPQGGRPVRARLSCALRNPPSADLQIGDPVARQTAGETQHGRAARDIAGDGCPHDGLSGAFGDACRLCMVVVSGLGRQPPVADRRRAAMGLVFVIDHGVRGEYGGKRVAILRPASGKIGLDRGVEMPLDQRCCRTDL